MKALPKIVAKRAGVMKGKFVHVVVNKESATISHRSVKITFHRGTRGYAKARQWATKRLK